MDLKIEISGKSELSTLITRVTRCADLSVKVLLSGHFADTLLTYCFFLLLEICPALLSFIIFRSLKQKITWWLMFTMKSNGNSNHVIASVLLFMFSTFLINWSFDDCQTVSRKELFLFSFFSACTGWPINIHTICNRMHLYSWKYHFVQNFTGNLLEKV